MPITTSSDGITLHYEDRGNGNPALVFVHGWCCNRRHWVQQIATFSPQYRTAAIDLAGHGDSGRDRDAWTMQAFGADVAAVADALELNHMVLIGHSMGGPVIIEAARLLGDRILGLVGADYFHHLDVTRTPQEIDEILAPFRNNFAAAVEPFCRDMFADDADPAVRDPVVVAMAASPPEIAIEVLGAILGNMPNLREGLLVLDIPTHTINSARNETDPEPAAAHNLQVHMMADVGHFCMLDDPAIFNMILREILEDLIHNDYHRNKKRP